MLTVTSPAVDTLLLTIEQLRVAAGLVSTDASQDATLTPLGERVSAEICTACNVAIGAGAPPTLRQETLTQTFRGHGLARSLVLSRRHEVTMASIVVDAIDVTGDYEVDPESGIVRRSWGVDGTTFLPWTAYGRTLYTVVYQAGFVAIPPDLSGVAFDLVRVRISEQGRDPLVKSTDITIPGVDEVATTFWVNAATAGPVDVVGALPADVMARLKRFYNVAVG